jgi:hypothetical protein
LLGGLDFIKRSAKRVHDPFRHCLSKANQPTNHTVEAVAVPLSYIFSNLKGIVGFAAGYRGGEQVFPEKPIV